MRLAHHREAIEALREPTPSAPWRVLVSGCLAGQPCGVNGMDYDLGMVLAELLALPTVQAVPFCPEEHSLGIPRGMPDIHGGDGFDVLDGRARVLDEHGVDLTAAMRAGAAAMLACAREQQVELAIVTDMSAACGSQVISDGCRLVAQRRFQRGVGVATALLLREGLPVVSQRDYHSLGRLRARLEPGFVPEPGLLDHHQIDWFIQTFGQPATSSGPVEQ